METGQIGMLIGVAAALAAVWQARLAAAAVSRDRLSDRVEVAKWRTRVDEALKALEARMKDRPRTAELDQKIDQLKSDFDRRADASETAHRGLQATLEALGDRFRRIEEALRGAGR